MTRQEKYPETNTFIYYNANPHNRKSDDCVIRAICTALDQPWEQTLQELTEIGLKHGYTPTDTHTYTKYLEQKGYGKYTQPRKRDNKKYQGWEWCDLLTQTERHDCRYRDCKAIIAHIGGNHIVCIKPLGDGCLRRFKVHDIWDSTDGCIGNYWVIR
jgi:hypothetical protein